jgi:membrane-bound metal-dependent hydrolase YbcI (DUF457 family)
MPFTPFHFGPGAALHALAPRRISFLAFCAANVVVDVEPLYYMLTHQYPLHRFFHTFVGVAVAISLTLALFIGLQKVATKVRFIPNLCGWKSLTVLPVVVGAVLGGYTHIVLDGLMHGDIRPLAPFSSANPFQGLVSLGALHWFCIYAGAFGLATVAIRKLQGRRRAHPIRP